jgi:transcriptional regulator with XRE-family HTH domain
LIDQRVVDAVWCWRQNRAVVSNDIDEAKLFALIGERIKQRRIDLGQTQAWLAKRVGMLRTSITNIETGRQKAPLHVIYALCNALEIDPLDILPRPSEVRRLDDEDVVIDARRVARIPRKAAEFLRGAIDDAARST